MRSAHALASAAALAVVLGMGLRVGPSEVRPDRQALSLLTRPVVFEANRGQTAAAVRFLTRTAAGTAFVTDEETVLAAPGGVLRMRPVTDAAVATTGLDELPGKVNYFRGRDAADAITGVPTYTGVRQRDVWPGIDVVWRTDARGRLEYDFIVAPGADTSAIVLAFADADDVTVDERGDAIVRAGRASFRHTPAAVWEETDGVRRAVGARFVADGPDRARIEVTGRDPSRTLTIDPVVYTSYLGGRDDSAQGGVERIFGVAKDATGATYLCGGTSSPNFPVEGAFQDHNAGGEQSTTPDAFVTKIDPTGASIVYSSYLGGDSSDEANAIAVDGVGEAFLTGQTLSTAFPTTLGALQATLGGPSDGFVAKVNAAGSALVYSTYVGGAGTDALYGIAVDGPGAAFIVGIAEAGFPSVNTSYAGGTSDVVVAKLAPTGAALDYATYLGGTTVDWGNGIVVTSSGEAWVTGFTNSTDFPVTGAATKAFPPAAFQPTYGGGSHDGFVARVDAAGTGPAYSTYLGGAKDEIFRGLAIDGAENVYVAGFTSSTDFPTVAPIQSANGGSEDAAIAKFAPDGSVVYSTYLGGSGIDRGYAAAATSTGALWVTGTTTSANLPVVGVPSTSLDGPGDALVAGIGVSGGSFARVAYVGGGDNEVGLAVALDGAGDPLFAGQTQSIDLDTTGSAVQTVFGGGRSDGFLTTGPAADAPPPAIESFFLPKRVKVIANEATPTRSSIVAAGFYDTGPDAATFTGAATLDVGRLHVDIPSLAPKGKSFTFAGEGFTLAITPNKAGSSRAKFKLKYKGDLADKVDLDGPLELHFANAATDGGGTVKLVRGFFALGKVRGSLVEPNLYPARAKAGLKGAGKDTLSLVVGLASAGAVPAETEDLTIGFGDRVLVTIPKGQFTRKAGTKDVFVGDVGGITKVTIAYLRDQIAISGKAMDLGAFDPGGNPVFVSFTLGAAEHAVRVRMARNGNVMKY